MLQAFIFKGASSIDRFAMRARRSSPASSASTSPSAIARNDVATSKRTGYQGPVVLCAIKYKPISGHYTTSEITNSLAQDDRILALVRAARATAASSSPIACC